MAKVYGVHPLELNPGVTPEDFESFIMGEGAPLIRATVSKTTILKGDRGARKGKYMALIEFDSVEDRDKAYPVADVPAEESARALPDDVQRLFAKWATLVSGLADPASYTDYVALTSSAEASPAMGMAASQNA